MPFDHFHARPRVPKLLIFNQRTLIHNPVKLALPVRALDGEIVHDGVDIVRRSSIVDIPSLQKRPTGFDELGSEEAESALIPLCHLEVFADFLAVDGEVFVLQGFGVAG
jgi:hypothetical protein